MSGFAAETAGARVQDGILDSSVSKLNRSSAEACNIADAVTVVVLTFSRVPLRIGCESAERATDAAGLLSACADGVGVPVRLG